MEFDIATFFGLNSDSIDWGVTTVVTILITYWKMKTYYNTLTIITIFLLFLQEILSGCIMLQPLLFS
ncbi:MAG: hypothetical protein SCARUB_04549 [Candidatus Scalindua rubra]|uniref:Uncharacterized protein n=1 Tax=Candidatus Scalindua rubra TaxID=1872076 RepID=A0A1E3X411_9BACT|nr:MAG: hypothetical protein SCARUB_04549 [Candidatus Scalindua rubra]